MDKVKMIAPWVEFYREVEALFAKDTDVKVIFDEESKSIKLYVQGNAKANALEKLLPAERTFGNVTVTLSIIPANEEQTIVSLFKDAFSGNKALTGVFSVVGAFNNDLHYIIFRKEVVQYFNDDLGDAHGVRSTLYQDIAKDVFGDQNGIFFCTDTEYDDVGKPLGEWP